jgi:hypothetical protein
VVGGTAGEIVGGHAQVLGRRPERLRGICRSRTLNKEERSNGVRKERVPDLD